MHILMKRLYVLIDQKLDVVYGCVQGGHAVAHWCVDNGYAKTYNGGVRSHISNAAKHKTKTAYGYRWEYAQ